MSPGKTSAASARQAAREKAAAMREADRRAEARRRNLLVAGTAVVVVLILFAVTIAVKLASKPTAAAGTAAVPASASLVSKVTSVPASVLSSVGAGGVSNPLTVAKGPSLTDGGRPLVVYLGAEYCPYCAAERWSMVVALSRFGTFSGLKTTHSSSTDTYPNTSTLSFYGSSYTSSYVSFQPVETQTNIPDGAGSYTTLQTPTAQQQQLMNTYDAPPYVSAATAGAIPFMDFGNKAILSGVSYSAALLSGLTQDQIASKLSTASDPIAQSVDGTANYITAMICKLTAGKPGSVCDDPAIVKIRAANSAAR